MYFHDLYIHYTLHHFFSTKGKHVALYPYVPNREHQANFKNETASFNTLMILTNETYNQNDYNKEVNVCNQTRLHRRTGFSSSRNRDSAAVFRSARLNKTVIE